MLLTTARGCERRCALSRRSIGWLDMTDSPMPLFEVFIRSKRGLDHRHVGSLHAEDGQQALEYARDAYTRRGEGVSIWVVTSHNIFASQKGHSASFYHPQDDKPYRHATF